MPFPFLSVNWREECLLPSCDVTDPSKASNIGIVVVYTVASGGAPQPIKNDQLPRESMFLIRELVR
jgi:hypothetical protein